MNKTVLVIGIIFLLIGTSVVSSTDNLIKDSKTNYQSLKSIELSKETLSRGNIAYAYDVLGLEPCYFYLDNPGNLTSFEILNCPVFACGTWTNFGKMLVCDDTGALWEINLCNRTALKIGGGGVTFYGLSYNLLNDKLYGITCSDLYEIDINTGNQTYIGSFGVSNTMIALAIDIDGNAYTWDVLFLGSSHLFSIDLETGEATEVADMGETLIYAQSGCFDWSTGTLWLTACSSGGAFLAYWDFDAQDLVHVSTLPTELCALVIPDTDDICPPVTTHSLDPLEPDGCNGWYLSNVNVTLNATDDMSCVKEIKYIVQDGPPQTFNGDNGTFALTQDDDGDDVTIEYWAIDNVGNEENHHTFSIDMDQTKPIIDLVYEVIGGNPQQGWDFLFTATATDFTSGMERVEFYLNDKLQSTVYEPGPCYYWEWHFNWTIHRVLGLIFNPQFTDEYVKFFAMMVIVIAVGGNVPDICAYAYDYAGNWVYDCIENPCPAITIKPGIYLFQSLTLPNNYTGKIGLFFINAVFDYS